MLLLPAPSLQFSRSSSRCSWRLQRSTSSRSPSLPAILYARSLPALHPPTAHGVTQVLFRAFLRLVRGQAEANTISHGTASGEADGSTGGAPAISIALSVSMHTHTASATVHDERPWEHGAPAWQGPYRAYLPHAEDERRRGSARRCDRRRQRLLGPRRQGEPDGTKFYASTPRDTSAGCYVMVTAGRL
jgi:hypothetical protein